MQPHQEEYGRGRRQELHDQLHACADTGRRAFGDLQIIIHEAEQTERDRDQQHGPNVEIGKVRPQQCREHQRNQDQKSAHGGRTLFFDDMTLRTIAADRLSLALGQFQPADESGPDDKTDEKRRHHRTAGAEREIAEHVEDPVVVGQRHQELIEQSFPLSRRGFARFQRIDDDRHAAAE